MEANQSNLFYILAASGKIHEALLRLAELSPNLLLSFSKVIIVGISINDAHDI